MKTELKYCPFCHASGGDIIAIGSGEHRKVECTVCGATHDYHMWQGRPTEASKAATVQPTDAQRREAFEAVNFCLDTIKNHRLKDEDNCIWSAGTSQKPRITAKVLKTLIRATTVPKNVDGLVKALQFYASGKHYREIMQTFGGGYDVKEFGRVAQEALSTHAPEREQK